MIALHVFNVSAQEKPSVSPVASSPSPTPTVSAPLTEDEKKKITLEFKKALNDQKASMLHQERSSIKELVSAQNQKRKKWREDQKRQRRQFFDQHKSGPERREYVQAYLKKKEEFEISIKTELEHAKKTWAEKIQNMKNQQKTIEEKFLQALSQGQRPSPEFWPSAI